MSDASRVVKAGHAMYYGGFVAKLERELAEARERCCQAMNDYETAVLREHRMQEQRDTYAAALRDIMQNEEAMHRMGYNPYLIASAALKGGQHD